MDCEEDSIYASPEPQPQVASTSTQKPPVARIHTSCTSKARKSLKFKNKRMVSRPLLPRPRRGIASNAEVRGSDWTVRKMGGTCPPFNENPSWIHDIANQRIYLYGGLSQGDESEIPTSELYVCDTTTMEWKDITGSLKFHDPYNPFSRHDLHRKATPLPQLTAPGCAIFSINDSSFIFIFGGYDIEMERVSSKIIVVNLDRLEWWYLRLEGEDVEARINPVVVAVDTKLYIFGGYKQFENCQPFHSYSVAEFLEDQQWHWTIRDEPYSNIVPQGHSFGRAVPVYNGAKLLLTPGRVSKKRVQFKDDNIFFYHIAKKGFQLAYITGDFPTDVLWYRLVPATPTCISSPMKRGRPRKAPPNSPRTSNTLSMTQPNPSTSSPSLIICAWIPMKGGTAAPELWQLFLTPDERVDRLNIAQQVYELNLDFRWFVPIDGKIRLMGYDDGHSDTEEGESERGIDPHATWNIFLDIPMPNGK